MNSISPCKDCTDRTVEPNCHMECISYREWSAFRLAEKKALAKVESVNIFKAAYNTKKVWREE